MQDIAIFVYMDLSFEYIINFYGIINIIYIICIINGFIYAYYAIYGIICMGLFMDLDLFY
mgnify:FL=1